MQELHFVTEKILHEVWSIPSLHLRALAFLSLMSLLRDSPHQCLKWYCWLMLSSLISDMSCVRACVCVCTML